MTLAWAKRRVTFVPLADEIQATNLAASYDVAHYRGRDKPGTLRLGTRIQLFRPGGPDRAHAGIVDRPWRLPDARVHGIHDRVGRRSEVTELERVTVFVERYRSHVDSRQIDVAVAGYVLCGAVKRRREGVADHGV